MIVCKSTIGSRQQKKYPAFGTSKTAYPVRSPIKTE